MKKAFTKRKKNDLRSGDIILSCEFVIKVNDQEVVGIINRYDNARVVIANMTQGQIIVLSDKALVTLEPEHKDTEIKCQYVLANDT